MSQQHAKFALVAVIALVCLAVAMWGLDPRSAMHLLAAFPLWLLPVVIAANVLITVMRAVRFRLLLDAPLPLKDALAVTAVGFFAINVVPLRMGEFARPALLSELYDVPFGEALGIVVVERLLDMFALLVLLGVVSAFVIPGATIEVAGVDLLAVGQRTFGVAVLGGLAVVAVLAVIGEPVVTLVERLAERVSPALAARLGRLGRSFVQGTSVLSSRPLYGLAALACTGGVWLTSMFAVAIAMFGFGIAVAPGRVALNWAATVVALALVPTPGNVGTFEAGSVASLLIDDVPRDLAQAFSLGNHALMTGTTLGLGAVFLLVQGWSVDRLVRTKGS